MIFAKFSDVLLSINLGKAYSKGLLIANISVVFLYYSDLNRLKANRLFSINSYSSLFVFATSFIISPLRLICLIITRYKGFLIKIK